MGYAIPPIPSHRDSTEEYEEVRGLKFKEAKTEQNNNKFWSK